MPYLPIIMHKHNEVRTAFIKSLPVMAGYITLGIGFGLVYTSRGLSPLAAVLFSVIVFAGSMQYYGVEFSMTALFVVTFTDQILKHKSIPASVLGLVATLVCLLVFGPESFLIPSLAAISVAVVTTVAVKERKGGLDVRN